MANIDRRLSIEEFASEKFFKGKKVPRLILWVLKKLLHEDFLNYLLESTESDGADFCEQVLQTLDIKLDVVGLDKIPADGSLYTFASNHPLGAIDGMTLCHLVGHKFSSVRMLVNDFLMMMKPLRSISIPINKVGNQVRNLNILVNEVFSSDNQVFIFPAGICSRKIDGKVQDLPWTKTFIRKSVEYSRKVVPVHFIGENSRRFYNIALISKFFGLKFNLAMLFLFDEVYKSRGKSYKVVFGEPIPFEHFDSSKTALQWAAEVRETVYSL